MDDGEATDDREATDNGATADANDDDSADDSDTTDDGDGAEDSSDNDATDDDLDNTSFDFDDMADPGGAAAAGGEAGCTKPITPTFAGEGSNIFEISSLAQEFTDSFLNYCQHVRIAQLQERRLKNLNQCLTQLPRCGTERR